MRDLTLWLLFLVLLVGVLAFSWLKYHREITAPAAAGAKLGPVIQPSSRPPSSVQSSRD